MAVAIFTKNSDNIEGALVGIAENESILENPSDYDIVNISDDLYNDIRLEQKRIIDKNGDNVNVAEMSIVFILKADLTNYINKAVSELNNWLKRKPSHSLATAATTYKDYISNLNVDSLITDPSEGTFTGADNLGDGTPLMSSLEKYVEDQGVTVVNTKQLL